MSAAISPARRFAAIAMIVLGPFWASAAAFMLGTGAPYVAGFALAGLGAALLIPSAGWVLRIAMAASAALGTWLVLRGSAA